MKTVSWLYSSTFSITQLSNLYRYRQNYAIGENQEENQKKTIAMLKSVHAFIIFLFRDFSKLFLLILLYLL